MGFITTNTFSKHFCALVFGMGEIPSYCLIYNEVRSKCWPQQLKISFFCVDNVQIEKNKQTNRLIVKDPNRYLPPPTFADFPSFVRFVTLGFLTLLFTHRASHETIQYILSSERLSASSSLEKLCSSLSGSCCAMQSFPWSLATLCGRFVSLNPQNGDENIGPMRSQYCICNNNA